MVDMPFLLPHQLVTKLFEHRDANFILNRSILEEDKALLRAHAEADPKTILPLCLWSAGVPCNWDRPQSLEIIALSLPSIPGFRFPLFCIKTAFQVKQDTMDSALQVLVWSFQQLALGQHPSQRHDGCNFDAAKENFVSMWQRNLCHSGCRCRSDWKMMKNTLGMLLTMKTGGPAGCAIAHQKWVSSPLETEVF